MPNFTNRWFSILLASLTLASCTQSVAQNNKTDTDTDTTKQSQASNLRPQPQQGSDVDPKVPLYEVNWEFCADQPLVLIDADDNNCVSNSQPLYVWTSDSRDNLDYEPKVLLWRQTIPRHMVKHLGYQAVIYSHGCFPSYKEPKQQAYYSAGRMLHLEKVWADNRITIEANATARRVDSTEEVKRILAGHQARNSLASFGGTCRLKYYQE